MPPMKSYAEELGRVVGCLFEDIAAMFPDLRAELERDLLRLQSFVLRRGLPAYLVDMPSVCKHLDRCLSEGQYISSGLPLTQRVSRKVAIPKFLRGLYLLVFDEVGRLRDDCNVSAVTALRQVLCLAKKVKVACSDERVEATMLDFLAVDAELPEPNQFWLQGDLPTPGCAESSFKGLMRIAGSLKEVGLTKGQLFDLTANLDRMSRLVCSALGEYNYTEWSFRHGPGAVSERIGTFHKYKFVNWSERLESEFPIADCGYHSYAAWAHDEHPPTSLTGCSRMIAVPKTFKKPRLIAAEPTENQWCQQNIWSYLESRVGCSFLRHFLVFRDQGLNRKLCLKASVDGRLSTLDLSDASDRLSCSVVQCTFTPLPRLLCALAATRTQWTTLPLNQGARSVRLRKFATMGSACTFPIESLVFLNVAIAACLTQRKLRVTPGNVETLIGEVGVFGDDIIVPTDCRDLVVKALECLHFKVNTAKSYSAGLFRESCGVDAFRGEQVTPAYWNGPCKRKPESVASTVAVANNFSERGYWHTARYIASTIPSSLVARVGADSGVFGLKTFSRVPLAYYVHRWNASLQRVEVRIPQPSVVVRKTATDDDAGLLQFFTEEPSPLTKWTHGIQSRAQPRIRLKWVAYESIQPKMQS